MMNGISLSESLPDRMRLRCVGINCFRSQSSKTFAKSAIQQNKAMIDVFMRGESYPLVLILVRILNQVATDFGIPINPLIQNWGYQTVHVIPVNRLVRVLNDMHQMKLSEATLMKMIGNMARRLGPVADLLQKKIAGNPLATTHLDETGFRAENKLHWIHTQGFPTLSATSGF